MLVVIVIIMVHAYWLNLSLNTSAGIELVDVLMRCWVLHEWTGEQMIE